MTTYYINLITLRKVCTVEGIISTWSWILPIMDSVQIWKKSTFALKHFSKKLEHKSSKGLWVWSIFCLANVMDVMRCLNQVFFLNESFQLSHWQPKNFQPIEEWIFGLSFLSFNKRFFELSCTNFLWKMRLCKRYIILFHAITFLWVKLRKILVTKLEKLIDFWIRKW